MALGPISGPNPANIFSIANPVLTREKPDPFPVTLVSPAVLTVGNFVDENAGVYTFNVEITQDSGGVITYPVTITLEPRPCIGLINFNQPNQVDYFIAGGPYTEFFNVDNAECKYHTEITQSGGPINPSIFTFV